jgi:hypothetical protein
MNFLMILYFAVLFYLLTPGVLITLPAGASRDTVNMTHAAVFAGVVALTKGFVWNLVK